MVVDELHGEHPEIHNYERRKVPKTVGPAADKGESHHYAEEWTLVLLCRSWELCANKGQEGKQR